LFTLLRLCSLSVSAVVSEVCYTPGELVLRSAPCEFAAMRTFSAVAESTQASLQDIAELIGQRAQREGCVRAQDVRQELERAGKSPRLWKDVLALARPSLNLRRGRYYYTPAVSDRLRQQLDQRATVTRAAQEIIR